MRCSPGPHTISEVPRAGYRAGWRSCAPTSPPTRSSAPTAAVTVAAGQNVECDVTNAEVPPTSTLTKFSHQRQRRQRRLGPTSSCRSTAPTQIRTPPSRSWPVRLMSSGVPTAGYRLVEHRCTDDDTAPPSLQLRRHAGPRPARDLRAHQRRLIRSTWSSPRADDGVSQIAGGPPFAYTITVDNLGPRDASIGRGGHRHRSTAQRVRLRLLPGQLHGRRSDAHVRRQPGRSPSRRSAGRHHGDRQGESRRGEREYTNMAYVSTADDPACVGNGCVPVCGRRSNNIACETTHDHASGAASPSTRSTTSTVRSCPARATRTSSRSATPARRRSSPA